MPENLNSVDLTVSTISKCLRDVTDTLSLQSSVLEQFEKTQPSPLNEHKLLKESRGHGGFCVKVRPCAGVTAHDGIPCMWISPELFTFTVLALLGLYYRDVIFYSFAHYFVKNRIVPNI